MKPVALALSLAVPKISMNGFVCGTPLPRGFAFSAKRALPVRSIARRPSAQHVQRITKMMVKLSLLM